MCLVKTVTFWIESTRILGKDCDKTIDFSLRDPLSVKAKAWFQEKNLESYKIFNSKQKCILVTPISSPIKLLSTDYLVHVMFELYIQPRNQTIYKKECYGHRHFSTPPLHGHMHFSTPPLQLMWITNLMI